MLNNGKRYLEKSNGKTAGVAMVISEKVGFNSRSVSSEIRNLNASNNRALKYMNKY